MGAPPIHVQYTQSTGILTLQGLPVPWLAWVKMLDQGALCRESGCGPPRLFACHALLTLPNCLVGPVSAFLFLHSAVSFCILLCVFHRCSLALDNLDL